MNITRDVIFDLLPAYFAGDVSADTRRLIDEFFAIDPEFRDMAEKFRRACQQRESTAGPSSETRTLERARARLEHRQLSGAFALAFGLAALFPGVTEFARFHLVTPRSWVFAWVFGSVAVISLVLWFRTKPDRGDRSTRRLLALALIWALALTALATVSHGI